MLSMVDCASLRNRAFLAASSGPLTPYFSASFLLAPNHPHDHLAPVPADAVAVAEHSGVGVQPRQERGVGARVGVEALL